MKAQVVTQEYVDAIHARDEAMAVAANAKSSEKQNKTLTPIPSPLVPIASAPNNESMKELKAGKGRGKDRGRGNGQENGWECGRGNGRGNGRGSIQGSGRGSTGSQATGRGSGRASVRSSGRTNGRGNGRGNIDDKVEIIIGDKSGTNESPPATSTPSSCGSHTGENEQTEFGYTLDKLTNAFLEDSDNDADPGADDDVRTQVDLQL